MGESQGPPTFLSPPAGLEWSGQGAAVPSQVLLPFKANNEPPQAENASAGPW